jgi:hypothetical protein
VQDRVALVALGMPNRLKGAQATSSVSGMPELRVCATEPVREAEQRAAGATNVVLLKRRKMRRAQRLQASRTEDLGAG